MHALGGSAARAFGAIREAISGADLSPGVSVVITDGRVSTGISLVVEYPHELRKVADDVRAAVSTAIETIVGMQAGAVDVTVKDVYLAADDSGTDDGAPEENGSANHEPTE